MKIHANTDAYVLNGVLTRNIGGALIASGMKWERIRTNRNRTYYNIAINLSMAANLKINADVWSSFAYTYQFLHPTFSRWLHIVVRFTFFLHESLVLVNVKVNSISRLYFIRKYIYAIMLDGIYLLRFDRLIYLNGILCVSGG